MARELFPAPRVLKNATLENQSERELKLTRATTVARREAGASGDQAERRRADGRPRIGEVRLIEYIERIRAELQAEPFGDLGGLQQGDIGVEEARSGNHVAPEISETQRSSWRRSLVDEHAGILDVS